MTDTLTIHFGSNWYPTQSFSVCPANRVGGGRGVVPSGSEARLLRKGIWAKRGDHFRCSPSWAEGGIVASASELGREVGKGRAY